MLFESAEDRRSEVQDAVKAFAECNERQAALLEHRLFSQERVEAIIKAQAYRLDKPVPHPAFNGQQAF